MFFGSSSILRQRDFDVGTRLIGPHQKPPCPFFPIKRSKVNCFGNAVSISLTLCQISKVRDTLRGIIHPSLKLQFFIAVFSRLKLTTKHLLRAIHYLVLM
jgi:hypothetical protein